VYYSLDYTILSEDISLDNLGAIDRNNTIGDGNLDGTSLESWKGLSVLEVRAVSNSLDNVIGKGTGDLGSGKSLEKRSGSSEGSVGRSKNGDIFGVLNSRCKASSSKARDEGAETGSSSNLDGADWCRQNTINQVDNTYKC
jgi:hypothetical protein